jgi:Cupin-like domain
MPNSLLVNWSQQDFNTVERGVLVARHGLADSDLFTDEALLEIIDRHPVEDFSVNTMGADPNIFDWREGDRNGVPAEQLLELVRSGQLWINCRKMLKHHPKIASVIQALYDEIEANNPTFKAEERSANLLISSPTAWVPYHVDMPVNMLWHIRGVKRVWVYPPFDVRFASPEVLGKVCSGEWTEEIPYDRSFDRYALVFDAQPGQLITWPQLTPHRVTNLEGLNVSLSTEHKNTRARRRINVHTANRLMEKNFGFACRGVGVDGAIPHAKQAVARAFRYLEKIVGKKSQPFVYPKTFVVDPDAEFGFRLLAGAENQVVAPHQELAATAV